MRKTLKYIICISIISLIGICSIKAETTAKYKLQDGKDQNFWIEIDKSKYVALENEGFVQYEAVDNNGNLIYLYTVNSDTAHVKKDKWWSTLYACKNTDYNYPPSIVGLFFMEQEMAIFPSSMESLYEPADYNGWNGFWAAMTMGDITDCVTIVVQDIPQEDQISFCRTYTNYAREINSLAQKYMSDPKIQYRNEYKEKLELIKSSCNRATQSADYNDACLDVCLKAEDDYEYWEDIFYGSKTKGNCGLSGRIITWILNIIRWVKYLLPVAVIILGILDFMKAMGSNKSDVMKQSQKRFVKRLIAAALVFLIPLLIQFVLIKLGFKYDGCGIF